MSVKPSAPRPAATLVLLRDRPGGGVETLLLERPRAARFAGGAFVFPGGKVEPDDASGDVATWCDGPSPEEAARRLGAEPGAPPALAYWVAAIREAFEEAGVLLARGPDGAPVDPAAPRFVAHRRACQGSPAAFWQMIRAEGLRLATDRLVYFAHWITPEEHPVRFDTRFFAAAMPAGQVATADAGEIVALRWLAPAEALAARERGALPLRVPTARTLALLEGAGSTAEALARLAAVRPTPIRPRLVTDGGQSRVVLPGEPGWS